MSAPGAATGGRSYVNSRPVEVFTHLLRPRRRNRWLRPPGAPCARLKRLAGRPETSFLLIVADLFLVWSSFPPPPPPRPRPRKSPGRRKRRAPTCRPDGALGLVASGAAG